MARLNAQAEDVSQAHPPEMNNITSFCRIARKDVFFMSYEIMRADFITRITDHVSPELLEDILSALDQSANRFDIKPKCTDLIVREDYLEPVRLYIASKSVENLTKGTLKNYYSTLRKFVNALQRPIDQITAVNVRVYLDNYKKTNGICSSTQEGIRIVIKDFFTWCLEEGLVTSNPCCHVKAIKYADNTRQPMNAFELESVRKACVDPCETALVEVLYSTAARISEVANMKISDIDFANKSIVIPHGKGDKRRVTYLSTKAIMAIYAYLATRSDDCDYLFVTKRYKKKHGVQNKALEEWLKKIVQRANVKDSITPHVFRTTASTDALERGMPIEQVQRFLGHAKIQTTLRYAKINDADVKRNHQKFIA